MSVTISDLLEQILDPYKSKIQNVLECLIYRKGIITPL